MVVEGRIARLPKARKRMSGEAFTKEFTIPVESPFGDMAGARAMKRSTLSLSVG
jgi:hypothetical protein